MAFDGNDYRKRVLAPIEARGGLHESDPFEWYDVPLADGLKDRVVTEQVEAVWAFWQKQRDHPKYRGLVTALLAVHDQVAPRLLDKQSRQHLAAEIRGAREQRDEGRFEELDAAAARLVERFGGIPVSKLEGLRALATQLGFDEAATERRLSRHRLVKDEERAPRPSRAAVPASVYRQVRADLDELGQLLGTVAPVSLFALLGVAPGASQPELRREHDLAAARNRELRPDRRRALVDDLLAAVTTLLVEGDPEAYLDHVAEEVTTHFRPRVAAAVLVEDELTESDHTHLLAEAEAAGLDRDRGVQVLATLARELGVTAPRAPARSGRDRDRDQGTGSAWGERPGRGAPAPERPEPTGGYQPLLSEARAALRDGRVLEAQRLVDRARQVAGGTVPPIRAVADEVAEVLAEAEQQWRAGVQALEGHRSSEAQTAFERLVHIASDVQGPQGRSVQDALEQARQGVAAATVALTRAEALVGPARELALIAAHQNAPDHPRLRAALQAVPVQPATAVTARVVSGGDGGGIVVSWTRSSSPGTVDYRVEWVDQNGKRRSLGTTSGTELEAALPYGGGPLPSYMVVARRAGMSSVEASTAGTCAEPPPAITSLMMLPHGRRVRLVFDPPERGVAQVHRLPEGVRAPEPGTVVEPAALGPVVPAMGPGLAIDPRPSRRVGYVVVTIDGIAIAGPTTWYAELSAVTGLRVADGRLTWEWPVGCTEVVVAWRADGPPERADDPIAQRKKVTNTRYDIDGGWVLPEAGPVHVAIFTCVRNGADLATSFEAPPGARLVVGAQPPRQ